MSTAEEVRMRLELWREKHKPIAEFWERQQQALVRRTLKRLAMQTPSGRPESYTKARRRKNRERRYGNLEIKF